MVDVVVVGAGPYGLSIASHLKTSGVKFRIFGSPMNTWLNHMPRGMRLKSEGFASSLYDAEGALTLAKYCKGKNIPYADEGLPVALETFACYGLDFQKRAVPELENKQVVSVERSSSGFRLGLENGEMVDARKVVAAVGLSHFAHVPPVLSGLPEEFVTHSSRHSALDQFKGREVVVVGAGASALDLAALLHQAGAGVQVVARKLAIRFHDPPGPRSLWERIRNPITGIGQGWEILFCARAPLAFHRLPQRKRLEAVGRILGPAPGWFVRDEVVGKVPFNLGVSVCEARVQKGRVNLELIDSAGTGRALSADHVITATGYKVDLDRLKFLNSELRAEIRSVNRTPVLSSHFESSVPGLYFVGTSAANSFGPLMRFAFGAGFAARRLTAELAKPVSYDWLERNFAWSLRS